MKIKYLHFNGFKMYLRAHWFIKDKSKNEFFTDNNFLDSFIFCSDFFLVTPNRLLSAHKKWCSVRIFHKNPIFIIQSGIYSETFTVHSPLRGRNSNFLCPDLPLVSYIAIFRHFTFVSPFFPSRFPVLSLLFTVISPAFLSVSLFFPRCFIAISLLFPRLYVFLLFPYSFLAVSLLFPAISPPFLSVFLLFPRRFLPFPRRFPAVSPPFPCHFPPFPCRFPAGPRLLSAICPCFPAVSLPVPPLFPGYE